MVKPSQPNDLDVAIEQYLKAREALDLADVVLSECVQPIPLDVESLYALIEKLPKKWSGCRRLYQRIIEIEKERET